MSIKPFIKRYKVRKDSIAQDLMAFTLKVISWLLSLNSIKDSRQLRGALYTISNSLCEIAKDRGVVGFINYVKLTRSAYFIYLSGEYPLKTVPGISVDSSGIPKVLAPFEEWRKSLEVSDPMVYIGIRSLTTLLCSTRALTKGQIPDILPITTPPKVVTHYEGKADFDFWRALGFRPKENPLTPKVLNFRKYHFSSKSGPNGVALGSSIADLSLIRLNKRLLDSIKLIGGSKLATNMDGLLEQFDFLKSGHPRYPEQRLRKVSYFPDKELKVRVIAVLDYWSQTALFPFHTYLYRVLKKIPQDCTHNQGLFKERIKDWTEFYSVDLTAATDRFPIQYIKYVLRPILPETYLDAWEYVMVGLPFEFKFQGKVTNITYATGTPMGAYTSWATFAVAHHYMMYSCCKELGLEWSSSKYCLLGDDILIGDSRLAKLYKEKILALGVDFSPSKTYESKFFSEFAKRLHYKGEEVTPFPISAVIGEKKFYELLPVFYNEIGKGWNLSDVVAEAIKSYYVFVKGFNSSYGTKIFYKALVSENLMLYMRGATSAINCLKAVYRQRGLDEKKVTREDICKDAIHLCLLDLFAASDPANDKSGKGEPLGELAVQMTCYYTGSEDDLKVIWACDNISRIPILNVYGQITEMYTQIRKDAKQSLKSPEIWPLMLKTVGLPLSDRAFVERQKTRLARGSSSIAHKLFERYDSLRIITLNAEKIAKKSSMPNLFRDFIKTAMVLPAASRPKTS
jgi:hypothetical protein